MPSASEPRPDVAYCDTGSPRYHGFRLDREMNGAWKFFRKDGSVMRSGEFDRGRQVGVRRTFDRAGKVVRETDLSKGR